MRAITEFDIRTDCWSGAKDTIAMLTDDMIDRLEDYLENEYFTDEVPTETEINDFIWFEDDTIADILGFDNFDIIRFIADHPDEDIYYDGNECETYLELEEDYERFMNSLDQDDMEDYENYDVEDYIDDNGWELISF